MPLTEERIRRPAECCSCDECGRPLTVGDTAMIDLGAGAVYCVTCAEDVAEKDKVPA